MKTKISTRSPKKTPTKFVSTSCDKSKKTAARSASVKCSAARNAAAIRNSAARSSASRNSASTRGTTSVKAIKTAKTTCSSKCTKRQKKAEKYAKVFGFSSKICAIAFIALAFIAISHLVRAINVVDVTTQNGIPTSWAVSSAALPDSMTAKVEFFDQIADCSGSKDDKYNFSTCDGASGSIEQGLVNSTLGSDGLPTASAASSSFERWFHEVPGQSRPTTKEISFSRVGETNKYTYGGNGIFPLEDSEFSEKTNGHNFFYTAHMSVPFRVALSGNETFEFTGDDDLFVFVNGQLVLDMGGIHATTSGSFKINSDGTITSSVSGLGSKSVNIGLKKGDIVDLDVFYAERNGAESNTLMTLSNIVWPATAKSALSVRLVNNAYVQYVSSVTNYSASEEATVDRLAAYHTDTVSKVSGYLPLSPNNLEFTFTPDDPNSWTRVMISDPTASLDGFAISDKIKLGRAGTKNDTAYFRFYVAPDHEKIGYIDTAAYYVTLDSGKSGVAYDTVSFEKSGVNLNYSAESNSASGSSSSVDMSDDTVSDVYGDDYLPVYGETVFIPNDDTLNEISASLFGSPFDAVAGNYVVTMVILLVFAGSFAFTYGFRRYAKRGRLNSHMKMINK